MNKLLKKQKTNNGILLILVVIIISILAGYNYYMQKRLENYARDSVKDTAEDISEEIDKYMDSAVSGIQATSYNVTQTMSDNILADSAKVLHELVTQTPFEFIEYVDSSGMNTTEKGEKFDASDRVYFQEGMKGNTGIWINYAPKYSKEYLLNFYTPLYYREKVTGVLTGVLGADTNILPMLKSDFFDEEMIGIMCDENGKIIASTLEMEKDTYLDDALSKIRIDEENCQLWHDNMNYKESRVFEFKDRWGKAIACISTNKRTDWKIIQYVPNLSFKAVRRENTSAEYAVTAIIIGLLLAFVYYQVKELRKEKDRAVQSYENILVATASETYKGIRLLDLETADSDYIYFENDGINRTKIGDWMDWLHSQQKNIYPEDWEDLYEVLHIDNLRQMKENEVLHKNYRSVYKDEDGYYRTYSTTVSIFYIEGKKTAVMSTIDNTEVVKKEIKQKNLLLSAASIYISMHVVDLKNDVMEPLKSEEHINKVLRGRKHNVQELFREMMTELTDDQFQEDMMSFVDFTTLDERMQDVNNISLEFLGKISGWCRARFIAVDYDEHNQLNRVLWVVENIDKEKKKSNRLRYLSETDLMTGIRNRGAGERKIKELIEENHEGMFCLLDIDKFKSVNDQFGHGVGDKVIIEIANCLKSSFRKNDIIMRLGGDEYAVFADGMINKQIGVTIIERFLEAIDSIDIPELGDRKITVSVGIAFKTLEDGSDFEILYKHADYCTYESKKIAGNAYMFFEA